MSRPWSFSRYSSYEECPRKYQYTYVDHLPSLRPDSPAASRGTEIHSLAEQYLLGTIPMYPPELQKVAAHAMLLKAKKATPEQKLAVREDWSPCAFEDADAYLRAIIDVIYTDAGVVHVQDWKTGQVYDKHTSQLETYVAIAAAHHPEATEYRARAIYIDQGVVSTPRVTLPNKLKPIRIMIDGRLKNAEADTIFPMKPGQACRWCNYAKKHGGPCDH